MPASFVWQPGPTGGTPTNAANLNRLAVTADIGTAGTPTGDALKAAFDARSPSLLGQVRTGNAAATTPDQLSGLTMWLKADALALTDGAAVASWTDSSGNARHATQGTAGNRPVFKTSILNGRPVIRFTAASSQYLQNAYGGEPGTVIVVGRQNTANTYASFCGGKAFDTGFAEGWYLRAQRTDGYAEFCRADRRSDSNNVPYLTAKRKDTALGWQLYMGTLDAATRTVAFYKDGYAQRVSSSYQLGALSAAMLVGAGWSYHSPGEFLNGDIAEVIIFNRRLSSTELDKMGAYLAAKYALPYTPVVPQPAVDMPLLMSTFSYDEPQLLHLLGSDDGVNWQHINGGVALYSTAIGEIHDPSIRRSADGTFWIAHTDTGHTFSIIKSRDLFTWEFVTQIDMTAAGLSGVTNVWAPEWFIDPPTGIVHVLVSVSTDNASTFTFYEMHLTSDTSTVFSAPVAIAGAPTGAPIDAFILWLGATYQLWYKGATYPEVYTSSSLTSGYTAAHTSNWGSWAAPSGSGYEGPSLVRFDGKWFLYTDDGHLKVSTTTDDGAGAGTGWSAFTLLTIGPAGVPRMNHGTPIRL